MDDRRRTDPLVAEAAKLVVEVRDLKAEVIRLQKSNNRLRLAIVGIVLSVCMAIGAVFFTVQERYNAAQRRGEISCQAHNDNKMGLRDFGELLITASEQGRTEARTPLEEQRLAHFRDELGKLTQPLNCDDFVKGKRN